MNELNNLISEVDKLLPQLTDFIGQFNDLVNKNNINVITDTNHNMSIDISNDINDENANKVARRVGIIDRLIHKHNDSLNGIFTEAKSIDNNSSSELKNKIAEFEKIYKTYKH